MDLRTPGALREPETRLRVRGCSRRAYVSRRDARRHGDPCSRVRDAHQIAGDLREIAALLALSKDAAPRFKARAYEHGAVAGAGPR